jgi:hypothetical protein
MAKVIFVALGLLALALANPADPEWPETFTTTFDETMSYPVIGSHSTTGTFYYDYTSGRYRVDRANGRYDRYCGINGVKAFEDTPCSHIVVGGNRYIYYPDKDECCFCCDASHGCGLVKPDWLEGAQYLGEVEYQGQKAYKWNKPGLQANYYYETTEANPQDRTILGLFQQPNDNMVFSGSVSHEIPAGKLDLPSKCSTSNTCSWLSTCHAVGNSWFD